ncbi:hypothetical protein, partial [Pseudomonas aeruginosa]|uniref:hypothetical protein n=1 Tax=Pseudomonas aeruginosa TaxID=287 RepID=UPI001BD63B0F
TDQRASGKGEMPLFAAQKRRIRHNVEYLDSVATATGVLNTILNMRLHAYRVMPTLVRRAKRPICPLMPREDFTDFCAR